MDYTALVNQAREQIARQTDLLQEQVAATVNQARDDLLRQVRVETERVYNVGRDETRFCNLLTVAGCAEYTLLTTDPISELWMDRDGIHFLLQQISQQEFYRFAYRNPNRGEPLYYCVDNLRLALWPTPATEYRLGWHHVPVGRVTTRDAFLEMTAGAWYGGNIVNPEAESKSIELLKSWLTPKQLKQFDRKGSFDVVGQATGKRYRIKNVTPYNVVELTPWGATRRELCFVPINANCIGDIMLAQKIMLETAEKRALRIANVKGKGWDVNPTW